MKIRIPENVSVSMHIYLLQTMSYASNIRPWLTKMGLVLGYIVQPDYLARRGVNAMFRGRAKVTVPALWNHILLFFVALIPTCLLRLIRTLGIF